MPVQFNRIKVSLDYKFGCFVKVLETCDWAVVNDAFADLSWRRDELPDFFFSFLNNFTPFMMRNNVSS